MSVKVVNLDRETNSTTNSNVYPLGSFSVCLCVKERSLREDSRFYLCIVLDLLLVGILVEIFTEHSNI